MIIYRITNSIYKDDISGLGASIYGGRWNSIGNSLLYCSEHISLAILELVVNFKKSESFIRHDYHLLEIEVPDTKQIILRLNDLKKNWNEDYHYSQYIGDEFLNDNSHLILKVPSSVIPEEHNYLVNPQHKDFSKIKINNMKKYRVDGRLVS